MFAASPVQIQVVNQASQFFQRAFDWRSAAEDGQQKIDESQFRRAKCSMYLYYKCVGPLQGDFQPISSN